MAYKQDPRKSFARRAESAVADRLAALGAAVQRTPHNENFDLLAGGAVRVEVKAAHWDGRRYQFNLRANNADWLVLHCVSGQRSAWFVIPFAQVQGLTVIKVTSQNPADYRGKWSVFYGAWELLAGQALQD